ncbi:DUF402 domain-containing protein [Melghirimyces algeriensis]|uniref:DUF402 domain-containing protein n=1 Tax=Melghirimyces algeriensis TaxID=910412 RepID=A0A521DWS1_9BACL|nr:DUF402 domain-containing protein [Melghirimyces algeriensis]SMO76048.1 hypothetical protein SAMN06264849_10741 [Melghirimyces algeriensis]
MSVRAGDIIQIESRKHSGVFHRSWERSIVLNCTDQSLLVANRDVGVTEADGRKWVSKGLALCQFHRNEWFNTILLFSSDGFYRFYCNIAAPFIIENQRLIYTDYDLDLLVEADGSYRWLDQDEFEKNRRLYRYPPHIVTNVMAGVEKLEFNVKNQKDPFNTEFVTNGYHLYLSREHQLMG